VEHWLDRLARDAAAGRISRRQVLVRGAQALAAATVLGGGVGTLTRLPGAGAQEFECGLQAYPESGLCDKKTGVCEGGSGLTCQQGQTCCNGECVFLSTDNKNCGVCGNDCTNGSTCDQGHCTTPCPRRLLMRGLPLPGDQHVLSRRVLLRSGHDLLHHHRRHHPGEHLLPAQPDVLRRQWRVLRSWVPVLLGTARRMLLDGHAVHVLLGR
jgi:stigma-specific protein Stig1